MSSKERRNVQNMLDILIKVRILPILSPFYLIFAKNTQNIIQCTFWLLPFPLRQHTLIQIVKLSCYHFVVAF